MAKQQPFVSLINVDHATTVDIWKSSQAAVVHQNKLDFDDGAIKSNFCLPSAAVLHPWTHKANLFKAGAQCRT